MTPYFPEEILIAADRQRQEFDPVAMEDLKESIDGKQLLHAVVVRDTEFGPQLVAGERRLRAIKDIIALGGHFFFDGRRYDSNVPTVTLGELDSLEAEEAELDENLKRRDLSWQEHSRAVEKLHRLRQAQFNKYLKDTPEAITNSQVYAPTVVNTAIEVRGSAEGIHYDITRKEILVAKHLTNPEVAKAKSLEEAWKVLKRNEKSEENRALAAKVGATYTASLHNAVHMGCISWMEKAIERQELFDIILTDGPYGMGADAFGDGGGKLTGIEHRYKDDYASWKSLFEDWCPLSYCITKPQAHAYLFCDLDRYHELKGMMERAGWYVFRTPIIDYKLGSGRVPLPDRGPRRCYELILYAIKGNKPVNSIRDDVIPCRADENMSHGAQKPISLYQELLMRSAKPGDKVLDTFAGSGTIFPAAQLMQCIATGIEQEPEYYGMCLKRLQDLKTAEDPMSELISL